MNGWLKIIIHSFCVSLGVILSFIFIGVISVILVSGIELLNISLSNSSSDYEHVDNPTGLKIDISNYRKSDSMVIFVGEIKKTDHKEYRNIEVVIELLDENGKYMDSCTDSIYWPFNTTDMVVKNFQAKCGDGCGYPKLNFTTYNIKVTASIKE